MVKILLAVIALPVSAMVALPESASHVGKSVLFELSDTLALSDSINGKKPKKDAIDAPVYYECTDSMVWTRNGSAYLFGCGSVKYDKVELTAEVISMNMED